MMMVMMVVMMIRRTVWRLCTVPHAAATTRWSTYCWTERLQSWPRRRTASARYTWVVRPLWWPRPRTASARCTWPYRATTRTALGCCCCVTPTSTTSPSCVHVSAGNRAIIVVVWPSMSCFADWSKRRHVRVVHGSIFCDPTQPMDNSASRDAEHYHMFTASRSPGVTL